MKNAPNLCRPLGALLLALIASGCASDPVGHADRIAGASGLHRGQVQTSTFLLTTYSRITDATKPYNIYIEGDGLAWRTLYEPSENPTPRKAVGLSLAALDPAANVIYIARPCQYTPLDREPLCKVTYWTDRRFSEEVITSINQAVDKLTGTAKTKSLNLIGYSGGGGVVVLVAARRYDVASLRTVAGNLDHVELNRLHEVTQMPASLNALDYAQKVATIPHIHFSGADDEVVSTVIAERFMAASQPTRCVAVRVIENASHEKGWTDLWPSLLKTQPTCDNASHSTSGKN